MSSKEKAAKPVVKKEEPMSAETVAIFQGITQEVQEKIVSEHDKLFRSTGALGTMVSHMEKMGVSAAEKNKVSVSTTDLAGMLHSTGSTFKILPTVTDGITRLPIRGTAYHLVIKKAEDFDMADEIIDFEIDIFKKAVEKNPNDPHLAAALKSISGNKIGAEKRAAADDKK